MKLYTSTRPDLQTAYTHASVSVLGWPVYVMFSPVSWDLANNRPGVGIISFLPSGWRWQDVTREGRLAIDLYRFDHSGPTREERQPWQPQEVARG